jgi:tetratricopeptide (TPR) repeat protein
VMGTLLRAGDEVRAVAQLVEAPSGTLLASHTVQAPLGDLFRLQDDICRRVVEGLSLGLTGERPATVRDVPHNPRAYEFFLRANELARTYEGLTTARGLYQQALDLDPGFAPAWAYIGRAHRVIGKFIEVSADSVARAEAALQRALELNPRLSLAHKFYAHLEADMGQSSRAILRLLGEATRHGNDPDLFAGLVHACRYGGLYDESMAAHAEARRLDPNVPTSVEQTMMMTGRLEELLALDMPPAASLADEGIRIMTLGLGGRRDEARQMRLQGHHPPQVPALQRWGEYVTAWLNGRSDDMRLALGSLEGLRIQDDPEALFIEGWLACDVGDYETGLAHFERALDRGYFVAQTLSAAPQFDPLRDQPRFQMLLQKAEAGRQQVRAAFVEAGGAKLLGV